MGKYKSDEPRPVVIYGVKNHYIKYVGRVSQENIMAIILQETEKAYLMRDSYNYPNVSREDAEFSKSNMWIPKSKMTNIREVGTCFNIGGNKRIEWRKE